MLKVRIIGVLVVRGGIIVQSIGFQKYLPIGSPIITVDYLNRWGIDEITLLDIDATRESRGPRIDAVRAYSKYCRVPLAVGGGIARIEQITDLIQAGADKVVLNTALIENPKLITEGARLFGTQSIVASIDARQLPSGKYEVYMHSGTRATGYAPAELAKRTEEYGAGEILLNSIERDGSKKGYDEELIQQVVGAITVPLIVCGGVGNPRHFHEAMRLGVSAVAAANFFHYTEHSVITAKSYLQASGDDVRLDSYASYNQFTFDALGRVAKTDDSLLEKLRFEHIPEEVI